MQRRPRPAPPRDSTWEKLKKTMRRLRSLRELGSPADVVAADVEFAKRQWLHVPPAPEGMAIAWPADLRELAVELGFEPDVRRPDDVDLRFDQRLGGPRPPQRAPDEPIVVPSLERARDLRRRIERGDIVAGLLPLDAAHEMVAFYRSVAEAGEAAAWRELAECHEAGIGVDPSRAAALMSRRRGAEAGDRVCALTLVRQELDAPEGNGEVAQRLIAPLLSDDEDGAAHVLAGYMAFRGFGEPRDMTRSAELHRKAAALGNADAMFELSVLESDEEQALSWCLRAAELGQPRACYNMGAFHARGHGVPQDWALAVTWYERAAELGNGRAAAALATMYELGDGVEVDPARAAHWDAIATAAGAIKQVKGEESAS